MNEWEPRAIEVVDAENIPPSLHETIGKLISTQCEMIAEAAQTPVGIAVTAAIVGILALQT